MYSNSLLNNKNVLPPKIKLTPKYYGGVKCKDIYVHYCWDFIYSGDTTSILTLLHTLNPKAQKELLNLLYKIKSKGKKYKLKKGETLIIKQGDELLYRNSKRMLQPPQWLKRELNKIKVDVTFILNGKDVVYSEPNLRWVKANYPNIQLKEYNEQDN